MDQSANSLNGTIVGHPTYDADVPIAIGAGKSIHFDGTNDWVDLGNPPSLDFGTEAFSFGGWIKTTQAKGSGDDGKGTIFSKGGDRAGGQRYAVTHNETTAGYVTLVFDDNVTKYVITNSSLLINDGVWHHVVGVRDGTKQRIYVDGRPEGTNATLSAIYDLSGTAQLGALIGAAYSAADLPPNDVIKKLEGNLDDVFVWRGVLTDAQIAQLYSGAVTPASLLAADIADVTKPGDPIFASSLNSPGSEGVRNAIDNQLTKYPNFDILRTGFTVIPSRGGTLVTGLALTSANDAPERDPASFLLEGSIDGISFFTISTNSLPAFTARYQTRYIFFPNTRGCGVYRLTFPTVADHNAAIAMQIAEVELLGVPFPIEAPTQSFPPDVTKPGDPIIASSNNSPASDIAANAIDDTAAKYLNYDILDTGFTVIPSIGATVVTGLSLTSANDAPERDPITCLLFGSNDGVSFVQIFSGSVPAFTSRLQQKFISFANITAYTTYRVIFPTVADLNAANSMQIAEVELLGVPLNPDQHLSFPLAGQTPYTAQIISVFDHNMSIPYQPGNGIMAFSGELGTALDRKEPPAGAGGDLYSFKKAEGTVYTLSGANYVGTQATGQTTLNYDGHPGYDYRAPAGTPVYAAADGFVSYPTSFPGVRYSTQFHTLAIDHGNGYKTYYLHLSTYPPDSVAPPANTFVHRGDLIGYSGSAGVPAAHLHFEVQSNGFPVDPYGWQGLLGSDPYAHQSPSLWDSPSQLSTNGLVGYWAFDDSVLDQSGNSLNGAIVGHPTYDADVPIAIGAGKSIHFDGTNDWVELGNPPSLDFGTEAFSFGGWIKTTQAKGSGDDGKGTIFSKGGDRAGGQRYAVTHNETTAGYATLVFDDNVTKYTVENMPTIISNGVWHHVVGVRDGTEQRIYIDARPEGTNATLSATYDLSGTAQLGALIGAVYSAADLPPNDVIKKLEGNLDDVFVWRGVLTAQQIADLCSGTVTPATLVGRNLTRLRMTAPTGGEVWVAGNDYVVAWQITGPASQISYYLGDYSLDGGSTWSSAAFYAPGTDTQAAWSVPSNIQSSQARVRLRAFTSSGKQITAVSSAAFTLSVPVGRPHAVPDISNRAPVSGETVYFSGTRSSGSSAGCGVSSYNWNFGDGTMATGSNPSHVYTSATGSTTYTASLTVTDCNSNVDTRSLTLFVTGQALGNSQPQQAFSKDPVNLATGNYVYEHQDLKIPGRGMPFVFERFYNSKDIAGPGRPLGFGWTHSYNISLSITDSNSAVISFGDGHREIYRTNGIGGYLAESGVFDSLSQSNGQFILTTKERRHYLFNMAGQLVSIQDKNSNSIAFSYTGPNLSVITDTAGRFITLSNDDAGLLTQITDPLGRTVHFTYDADTNLISVKDLGGNLTQFAYDQYHQMTNATDPRGNAFVSMVYDAQRRVVASQRDALLNATAFDYDFVNRITTVTDPYGNRSYNYYDDRLRIVKIVDSLGNSRNFEYDTYGNRTKVIDKAGYASTYTYDTNGNVTSKTDPLGYTTLISYDPNDNPTDRLDVLGGTTRFQYDVDGNLTKTIDALGHEAAVVYDTFGEPIVLTDANQHSTTNTYDALGNLSQTHDSNGGVQSFAYDPVGRKLAQVDRLGRTNRFSYDNGNNLIAFVDGVGNTNLFGYDGNNNLVTARDFLGNTTTKIYDQKDRLVAVIDPGGGAITNTYDALDHKIAFTDARGAVTLYSYDAIGNLSAVTNAEGGARRYTYDANGNRTSVANPKGNITINLYDPLNRLVSTQDALGHSVSNVFDALGRPIATIDPLNRTNRFSYDPLGRLTQFTDAAGGIVVYTYDNIGNRTSTTDPDGHTTTNVFDALNRLARTVDPDGNASQFVYDAEGNLISRTDANVHTITYLYDANNRRMQITYPGGTSVTFAYDANGNRTNMTDSLGTTAYSYDALNRLSTASDPVRQHSKLRV